MLRFSRLAMRAALAAIAGGSPGYVPSDAAFAGDKSLVPTVIKTIPIPSPKAGSLQVAINETTNRVYIGNIGDGTVTVIDGKTDEIIDTITIPPSPLTGVYLGGPGSIAINETTNTLYVLTQLGTIAVVDGNTDEVVNYAVIDSNKTGFEGFFTPAIQQSQKNGKLYVSNADVEIDVIDPKTLTVLKRIPFPWAYYIIMNQTTNTLYAPAHWDDTVLVIDGDTDTVKGYIKGVGVPPSPPGCNPGVSGSCTSIGSENDWADVDEGLDRLYVASESYGLFIAIDTAKNSVIKTLNLPNAFAPYADSTNQAVYITAPASGTLDVVDEKTLDLVGYDIQIGPTCPPPYVGCPYWFAPGGIQFDSFPQGVKVNETTGKIYVADFGWEAWEPFLPIPTAGPSQIVVLQIPQKK